MSFKLLIFLLQTTQLSLGAVKTILEVLCDEGGFLVEEKLNKLLQPLENDERSLIKLDAIFKVSVYF